MHVVWEAKAGDHTLSAVADADDNVTEANEANNEAITTYHVDERPRPNLVPRVDLETFEQPLAGENVTAEIEVANTADPDHDREKAESGAFVLEVARDGDAIERTRIERELDPGDVIHLEERTWRAQAGDHTFTVRVDDADEVNESDETDNVNATSYTVFGEPPDPNLVAASVAASGGRLVEGQQVDLAGLVEHTGAGVANVSAAFQVDGRAVARASAGDLPHRDTSATATAEDAWTAEAGNHTVGLVVDPDDAVNETDESDNRAARSVTVLEQADPAVEELRVAEPPVPWTGHEVRVDLSNDAEGPMVRIGGVHVEVCPAEPSVTLQDCRDLDPPGRFQLEPGGERTLGTHWNADGSVGEYRVCAEVVYGPVQETRDNDRACEDTYAVATAGPGPSAGR